MLLTGRKKIKTNYRKIDDDNIGIILQNSFEVFSQNLNEIEFLYNYFKGDQPILNRQKKIRPEIINKIVENHANSIVKFKTGYLLQKPIQYTLRKGDSDEKALAYFNDCMELEDKDSKDKEVANAQAICGTSYRLALPNKKYSADSIDESPFEFSTVSSKKAFVVYSSDIGEKPLLGVIILVEKDDKGNDVIKLQAYTEDKYYVFNNTTKIVEKKESHTIGRIPLVEYPYNEERMGAFEPVIPLLDAINNIESNRVDGIEQFIQAIMVFKNVDITKEMLQQLKELGAISIEDNGEIKANVDYLQQELNQTQVQTLVNYLLEVVYRIVGMPMGNNKSGDDTGTAVIMRDGWSEAEARTQDTELMFRKSEKEFLRLALYYMRTLSLKRYELSLTDIEIKFTRRNYENIYQKAQVLDLLLKDGKVAPKLAFQVCGLFSDPEQAYMESKQYIEETNSNVVPQAN